MNKLILTYALIIRQNNLKLSRIGSHPLENFFGRIRNLCKNFDSFENFLRCTIKTFTNLSITRKHNLSNKVQNRINVAGTQIDEHTGWFNINDTLCPYFNAAL